MQYLNRSNPYSPQNDAVLLFYVLMHALPGIVDGARKTSQIGRWVEGDSVEGGSGRFSLLPMLEATSSRDQRMSAVY